MKAEWYFFGAGMAWQINKKDLVSVSEKRHDVRKLQMAGFRAMKE